MDFQIKIYRYTGSVHPHGEKAKTKGEVMPSAKGKFAFDFLAPNDETAMSYLNWIYEPKDKRNIGGQKLLTEFCKSEADTPSIWQNTIESCMFTGYNKDSTKKSIIATEIGATV